jgi:hypothetical protein
VNKTIKLKTDSAAWKCHQEVIRIPKIWASSTLHPTIVLFFQVRELFKPTDLDFSSRLGIKNPQETSSI